MMNGTLGLFQHDLATAFARLRMRPGYALLATGMLALAIASNVAVFSVLSRTLLRPFPFNDDRLVVVFTTHRDAAGEIEELPSGSVEFVHWRMQANSLEGMEVLRVFSGSITDRGETESVKVGAVSGGIFRLLGVRPAMGNDFRPADDRPDSTTIILSHGLWRRRFGSDRNVIGRTLIIDGKPRTIAAVMPQSFAIPNYRADVYVPVGFSLAHMPNPGSRAYTVFARLKYGVRSEGAAADLQRISRELEKKFPVTHIEYGAAVKPFREALYGERRPALLTLFVAVLLVHLLACVNVANLVLAQISDQSSVTAVRLAIGARPAQIVRYRVAEGLLISVASSAAGLVLGTVAVGTILRNYADVELLSSPPGTGGIMAAFVVALTVVTAMAVSLLPALRETKVPLSRLINEGSQRTSSSPTRRRARELFIIAEVALAIPLLIGAAVAVKRFRDLRTFDIGFTPDRVMTAQLIMPERYDQPRRIKFAAELIRRLQNSPGVASAALTTCTFRVGGGSTFVIRSETMVDFAFVNFRRITPRYFETMSAPVLAGRPFNDDDIGASPPVAIVSQSFAKQFWPNDNPLGKKLFRKNATAPSLTVVGVAREIRDGGVAEDLGPTLYTAYLQNNHIYMSIVARATGDVSSLRNTIKNAVQSIDPALAPDEVIPFKELVEESLGSYKLQVALLGGFGLIALLLATVGVFAVTSYAVAQQMPEVGIRMAFGASPRAVVTELLRASGRSVAAGVIVGIGLTVTAVRGAPVVLSFKPDVDPRYAATVVAVLVASSILAILVPALRARGARPAELLRKA